jgi:hypothetical protein
MIYFLMGYFRKIQKNMKERKRRDFYECEDSRTRVFSMGQECPQATPLVQRSLKRTHLYGNLPYNKMSQICSTLMCFRFIPCNIGLLTWVGTSYFPMPMEKGIF